jgi:hypothetical protein
VTVTERASVTKHALSRRPLHICDRFRLAGLKPWFAGCHLIAIYLYGG